MSQYVDNYLNSNPLPAPVPLNAVFKYPLIYVCIQFCQLRYLNSRINGFRVYVYKYERKRKPPAAFTSATGRL
jgi:hypothetical protein